MYLHSQTHSVVAIAFSTSHYLFLAKDYFKLYRNKFPYNFFSSAGYLLITQKRGPARVNSDKRHGPKSSDSA